MRIFLFATLATTLTGALGAQSFVIPAPYDGQDAPSQLWIAGVATRMVQQIMIDPQHLFSLRGKEIVALSLRRDTGSANGPLPAAQPTITLRLSGSPRTAAAPSATLAENLGVAPTVVYSGLVSVPLAPAVSAGASVPWDASNAIRIPFTTPFPYSGGTLCFELDGDLGAGFETDWPADAAYDGAIGSWSAVGDSCGRRGGPGLPTAFAAPGSLVPGGTARLFARGEPGDTAITMFGLSPSPNALPLAFIGAATNCHLHMHGFIASVTTTYGPLASPINSFLGGYAYTLVDIPNGPRLLGARFVTQWFTLGSEIAASNAVLSTLASRLPTLGMATIDWRPGAPPGVGNVTTLHAPVLRLEVR